MHPAAHRSHGPARQLLAPHSSARQAHTSQATTQHQLQACWVFAAALHAASHCTGHAGLHVPQQLSDTHACTSSVPQAAEGSAEGVAPMGSMDEGMYTVPPTTFSNSGYNQGGFGGSYTTGYAQ